MANNKSIYPSDIERRENMERPPRAINETTKYVSNMETNDFKEPIPFVVLPFENPNQELLPIPFMGKIKDRKCSNRKKKTISKKKRKMVNASKKKNRNR